MPDAVSGPPADDQAAAHVFAINAAQGMTHPRQVLCPAAAEGHPWFLVDSDALIACPWCEIDRLRPVEQRAREVAEGRVKAFGLRVRTDDVGAALYILGTAARSAPEVTS